MSSLPKAIIVVVLCVLSHEWAIHSIAKECRGFGVFYNGRDAYACKRAPDMDDASGAESDAQRTRSFERAGRAIDNKVKDATNAIRERQSRMPAEE